MMSENCLYRIMVGTFVATIIFCRGYLLETVVERAFVQLLCVQKNLVFFHKKSGSKGETERNI